MRILFFGTPEFAVPPLEALHIAGHRIVLVVTRPDARSGRGLKTLPSPVKSAALRLGLPIHQPRSVNKTQALERFRTENAELGVVVAFGQILGRELLRIPQRGFLNLHASLLPRYRGAAPINWAITKGEKETGVSVVRMSAELDAGPILAQQAVPIGEDSTAGELHDVLCRVGTSLLADVINRLNRGEEIQDWQQDESVVSYAPKLTKKDRRVDWNRTAAEICNMIRGLSPWPGACSRFIGRDREEEVILVRTARSPEQSAPAPPGAVVEVSDVEGILVNAGEGAVRILELKPASGRAMTAADFAHGRRVRPGDCFA